MKITKLHCRFFEFFVAMPLWFDMKFVSISLFTSSESFLPFFFTEAAIIHKFNLIVKTGIEGEYVAKNNEADWFFPSFLIEFKYFPFNDVESVRKKVIKIRLLSSIFLLV